MAKTTRPTLKKTLKTVAKKLVKKPVKKTVKKAVKQAVKKVVKKKVSKANCDMLLSRASPAQLLRMEKEVKAKAKAGKLVKVPTKKTSKKPKGMTPKRAQALADGLAEFLSNPMQLPKPRQCEWFSYYRDEDCKKMMSKKEYAEFCSWMTGQTTGVIDGKTAIYEEDVCRFLRKIRHSIPTYFD